MSNPQPSGLSEDTKTIITVLLLVFVYPIGVIMMWVWMKWPVWLKILITLILILPFIAIMSIVGLTAFISANPTELRLKANDAARLTDLANLQEAINKTVETSSIPNLFCHGQPGPCQGSSTDKGSNVRNIDGTGWVKINLSNQKTVSLPQLPVDPVNDVTYFYTYCSDGKNWEIEAKVQSKQVLEKAKQDDGDKADKYEVGSDLTLCP